jgi:NTP pyrophosphatase (non-canonical NTP hydrolase)
MFDQCKDCNFSQDGKCIKSIRTIESCKVLQVLSAVEVSLITFEQFQQYRMDVNRTAPVHLNDNQYLIQMALGVCKEAGEVADVIDKAMCQGHDLDVEKLIKELGDMFFYMVAIMNRLAISLFDILSTNIKKRLARFPNGFSFEASRNRKDATP